MAEKRVLITGATDGIGMQTAVRLAEKGFEVWIHGRNYDKVEWVKESVIEKTHNENIFGIAADFSSLYEVKSMVIELKNLVDSFDVIINNAGIINLAFERTVDGFERTFQVNYLSHFLLTSQLLPMMKEKFDARIINLTSMIHADSFDENNLQVNNANDYAAEQVYSNTKLYNILFTFKLARMLQGSTITANCLHPGVINTKLLRASYGDIGMPVESGADTSVFLASSPDIESVSGRYFANSRISKASPVCYDKECQDILWNKSLDILGNYLQ
ncbi:MAG: SDR family oxidoreductase [Bacteroidota bacterium]|nr:SDR family oxidoreductase [Bacteroidota bacterium]